MGEAINSDHLTLNTVDGDFTFAQQMGEVIRRNGVGDAELLVHHSPKFAIT